jgi:outer membrane protein OmpA-like peptidoglycan-associated protein
MTAYTPFVPILRRVVLGASLLLAAPLAHAQPDPEGDPASRRLAPGVQMSIAVEPGLAVALTDPQSQRTDAGFGQSLKLLFGVGRYLELGPTAAFTTLPTSSTMPTSGTSWAFGGGGRVMRPHDAPGGAAGLYAISPWADADLLYVRTGSLDRIGFAAAVGAAMPLDNDRRFWLGPYVRYFQIAQGERTGFDNRDAKILAVGIGLEVGGGLAHRRARVARVEPVATPEPPPPPSDRDHDGVADDADDCPDLAGPIDNAGCPVKVIVEVEPDRLEVTSKIAFEWDSARLDDASRPVLDTVAQTLAANPRFRVEVDGHASSEGDEAHNQTLSKSRATAVVDYLVTRGVASDRLIAKGFSSSVPAASNTTAAGRVANRRVEFVVDFILITEAVTP